MVSAKPWKLDAIVRLFLSVILCVFAGSLAGTVLYYTEAGHRLRPWFFVLVALALGFLGTTLRLLRRRWSLEELMPRALVMMITFYAGFLLGLWAQKIAGAPPSVMNGGQVLIAGLSFQGAALVLIGWFLKEHRMSWADAFGFDHHWLHALLLGVALACLYLPVGRWLQSSSAELMLKWRVNPQEQETVKALRTTTGWTYGFALGLVAIVLAPVAEEMLFRGILYPAIKQAGHPRLALWGTALLFAGVHFNLVIGVPLFVLALVLALLYEKTNNLLAPITAHAAFNALNFAILYWEQKQGHWT